MRSISDRRGIGKHGFIKGAKVTFKKDGIKGTVLRSQLVGSPYGNEMEYDILTSDNKIVSGYGNQLIYIGFDPKVKTPAPEYSEKQKSYIDKALKEIEGGKWGIETPKDLNNHLNYLWEELPGHNMWDSYGKMQFKNFMKKEIAKRKK